MFFILALILPSYFVVERPSIFSKEMSYFLSEESSSPFVEVKRKYENNNLMFLCYSSDQTKLGMARPSYSPTTSILKVFNNECETIATIKHQRSLILPPAFEILDSNKRTIAQGEMNWVGTRFTLYTPEGKEIATYSRPYFRVFGKDDFWHVSVRQNNFIYPTVLFLIGIFQTDLQLKETSIRPAT